MGDTLMGSEAKQVGQAQLMTPKQQKFLNMILGGTGNQSMDALGNLLQGYDEDMFQQGVVDPSMREYQNQILPSIQQRFVDANAGSSSALNQALTQSAGDLTSVLAGKRIDLQNSMAGKQLGALGQILGLLGQRAFDPIVQGPQAGMLKDLVGSAPAVATKYFMG